MPEQAHVVHYFGNRGILAGYGKEPSDSQWILPDYQRKSGCQQASNLGSQSNLLVICKHIFTWTIPNEALKRSGTNSLHPDLVDGGRLPNLDHEPSKPMTQSHVDRMTQHMGKRLLLNVSLKNSEMANSWF